MPVHCAVGYYVSYASAISRDRTVAPFQQSLVIIEPPTKLGSLDNHKLSNIFRLRYYLAMGTAENVLTPKQRGFQKWEYPKEIILCALKICKNLLAWRSDAIRAGISAGLSNETLNLCFPNFCRNCYICSTAVGLKVSSTSTDTSIQQAENQLTYAYLHWSPSDIIDEDDALPSPRDPFGFPNFREALMELQQQGNPRDHNDFHTFLNAQAAFIEVNSLGDSYDSYWDIMEGRSKNDNAVLPSCSCGQHIQHLFYKALAAQSNAAETSNPTERATCTTGKVLGWTSKTEERGTLATSSGNMPTPEMQGTHSPSSENAVVGTWTTGSNSTMPIDSSSSTESPLHINAMVDEVCSSLGELMTGVSEHHEALGASVLHTDGMGVISHDLQHTQLDLDAELLMLLRQGDPHTHLASAAKIFRPKVESAADSAAREVTPDKTSLSSSRGMNVESFSFMSAFVDGLQPSFRFLDSDTHEGNISSLQGGGCTSVSGTASEMEFDSRNESILTNGTVSTEATASSIPKPRDIMQQDESPPNLVSGTANLGSDFEFVSSFQDRTDLQRAMLLLYHPEDSDINRIIKESSEARKPKEGIKDREINAAFFSRFSHKSFSWAGDAVMPGEGIRHISSIVETEIDALEAEVRPLLSRLKELKATKNAIRRAEATIKNECLSSRARAVKDVLKCLQHDQKDGQACTGKTNGEGTPASIENISATVYELHKKEIDEGRFVFCDSGSNQNLVCMYMAQKYGIKAWGIELEDLRVQKGCQGYLKLCEENCLVQPKVAYIHNNLWEINTYPAHLVYCFDICYDDDLVLHIYRAAARSPMVRTIVTTKPAWSRNLKHVLENYGFRLAKQDKLVKTLSKGSSNALYYFTRDPPDGKDALEKSDSLSAADANLEHALECCFSDEKQTREAYYTELLQRVSLAMDKEKQGRSEKCKRKTQT